MECLEFRRWLGAEPLSQNPDFLAHLEICPPCAAAWRRAQAFEKKLRASFFNTPEPSRLADRILLKQATLVRRAHRHRWQKGLALAASLILIVGLGTPLALNLLARYGLPMLSAEHIPGEAMSLSMTQPVPNDMIRMGFANRDVQLAGPPPSGVTYVQDCLLGPFKAVHLVMRREGIPITVFFIPNREGQSRPDFIESGLYGMEMPLQHGTLLLLSAKAALLPDVAKAWTTALDGPSVETATPGSI